MNERDRDFLLQLPCRDGAVAVDLESGEGWVCQSNRWEATVGGEVPHMDAGMYLAIFFALAIGFIAGIIAHRLTWTKKLEDLNEK